MSEEKVKLDGRSKYTVEFDIGELSLLHIVKEIKEDRSIGLKEAKDLVDKLVLAKKEKVSAKDATDFLDILRISGIKGSAKKVSGLPVEPVTPKAPVEPGPHEKIGLIAPFGTRFKNGGTSYGDGYILESYDEKRKVCIVKYYNSRKKSGYGGELVYNVETMNRNFKSFYWLLIDPAPELLKIIGKFCNVVKRDKFKANGTPSGGPGTFVGYMNTGGGGQSAFYVGPGFTANCQLTVVGLMVNIINRSTNVVDQLKEIAKLAGRRCILCDVPNSWRDKLKKMIPEKSLIMNSPYKSSNGSSMNVMIIDTGKF